MMSFQPLTRFRTLLLNLQWYLKFLKLIEILMIQNHKKPTLQFMMKKLILKKGIWRKMKKWSLKQFLRKVKKSKSIKRLRILLQVRWQFRHPRDKNIIIIYKIIVMSTQCSLPLKINYLSTLLSKKILVRINSSTDSNYSIASVSLILKTTKSF